VVAVIRTFLNVFLAREVETEQKLRDGQKKRRQAPLRSRPTFLRQPRGTLR